MHLSLDIDRKWCTVHILVLTWEMFCGQYVTLANAYRANRELSFKCTQMHCDFAKTDLSFLRKSRDFCFGSITMCRSWIHIQFKAIIKRILSQNAAYNWLILSFACFISTQCTAMQCNDRYLTCISKYLQVFRFQCECQRVDRFTFDCIGSSLCHTIVLPLLSLQKFTKSPHKLLLVQCTTNANT